VSAIETPALFAADSCAVTGFEGIYQPFEAPASNHCFEDKSNCYKGLCQFKSSPSVNRMSDLPSAADPCPPGRKAVKYAFLHSSPKSAKWSLSGKGV